MRTEAARRGLRLSNVSALSVAEQASALDKLLDDGVDTLVMKPMGGNDPALLALLRRAQAAGVPVITLDSFIDDPAVICTVGSDNEKAIARVAEFVFERMGARGKVAYFQGDDRLPAGALRNAAFHRLLPRYPGISLVHEDMLDWVTPMSRQGRGAELMRALLARHPDLDALITASDEAALGAIDAIAEAGLAGRILVSGFDALPEALLCVRDGTLAATIRQMPQRIADRALEVAVSALEGRSVPRRAYVDTELITADNMIETALGSLRLVPGLIYDLSANHQLQRELQQSVIDKQAAILRTVVAVSNAVGRMRDPQAMKQQVAGLLCEQFGLDHAAVLADGAAVPASSEACASQLVLPLKTAERELGVLYLRSARPKAFDAETVAVLQAIAHQLAIALDNANLYAETVRLAQSELRESRARLAHAERAEYLALHDALTGLPNRRLFNRLLDQAISQSLRYHRKLAVMFVDLDHFKQINDTLGHEAGDKLLQQAAQRLKDCLRESDTVARLGGDEFVVLLTDLVDAVHPATVAQKVIAAVANPFTLIGHAFRVTASVGISVYPEDGTDEQTLAKNADIALYHAKKEGKDNYQFYSPRLNTHSLERVALEASLRRALERQEFRLHYQAKRDTGSDRITGMEVLLRWQHPDRGLVAPLRFLPVAEETGLIVPLGKWVLRTACRQNMEWQAQGLPPLVAAVNLTPRQFNDDALVPDIRALLAETGMPADLLELEITEKTLMQDNERTLRILRALKTEGVRIAIDDFGTGYSSLSALKKFPLDTIKIDHSFIRGACSTPDERHVAEAIIAMGRTLSLTIVAQGVETREQADFLRQHACDEFQGFYFNAPVPAEQFATALRKQGCARPSTRPSPASGRGIT
ncbi:EAL domain-containing protein [Piscinibacter sp. XHJ-5]|uniref:EAL domain-containing protein n=1 Tax=Piscinibacter sp. XHJ-5 TaxID=3037797 RepID=UPI002452CAE5|nr:EAL domain-containing protein [Piscinibacter sp. XHJ-5]